MKTRLKKRFKKVVSVVLATMVTMCMVSIPSVMAAEENTNPAEVILNSEEIVYEILIPANVNTVQITPTSPFILQTTLLDTLDTGSYVFNGNFVAVSARLSDLEGNAVNATVNVKLINDYDDSTVLSFNALADKGVYGSNTYITYGMTGHMSVTTTTASFGQALILRLVAVVGNIT